LDTNLLRMTVDAKEHEASHIYGTLMVN